MKKQEQTDMEASWPQEKLRKNKTTAKHDSRGNRYNSWSRKGLSK